MLASDFRSVDGRSFGGVPPFRRGTRRLAASSGRAMVPAGSESWSRRGEPDRPATAGLAAERDSHLDRRRPAAQALVPSSCRTLRAACSALRVFAGHPDAAVPLVPVFWDGPHPSGGPASSWCDRAWRKLEENLLVCGTELDERLLVTAEIGVCDPRPAERRLDVLATAASLDPQSSIRIHRLYGPPACSIIMPAIGRRKRARRSLRQLVPDWRARTPDCTYLCWFVRLGGRLSPSQSCAFDSRGNVRSQIRAPPSGRYPLQSARITSILEEVSRGCLRSNIHCTNARTGAPLERRSMLEMRLSSWQMGRNTRASCTRDGRDGRSRNQGDHPRAADRRGTCIYHLSLDNNERYIYFFDTPELSGFEAGIIARARRIVGSDHDSTIKFRPIVPEADPAMWPRRAGSRSRPMQARKAW